jgi:hypothetical protein
MRKAEIRKITRLRESVLVNKSLAGKNPLVAIHIIRGTKLPISGARIAAGDTVAAIGPGPPHRVAHRDVDLARIKRESRSDLHIENLTATRRHAAHGWSSILIYDVDGMDVGALVLRRGEIFVVRIGLRQKYNRKHRYQPISQLYYYRV